MNILTFAFVVVVVASVTASPIEYLPPVEAEAYEYPPPGFDDHALILADDGYRYKTVRKLRLRHRRDISEISDENLKPIVEESMEFIPEEPMILAEDGYRYKTVKKLRLRHRRDVGQQVVGEYIANDEYPTEDFEELPLEGTLLAVDGYRYKTVKKLRHRRDVSEVANEYLPAVEEDEGYEGNYEEPTYADGYRYKTVRKLKYRHRH